MEKPRDAGRLSLTLALGVLGGAGLVIANATVAPGKEILIPYALLVLLSAVVTRGEAIESFWSRFFVLLGVFMLSSVVLYAAIGLNPRLAQISALGHLWRFGILLAIGILVSLPTARVTAPPRWRLAP